MVIVVVLISLSLSLLVSLFVSLSLCRSVPGAHACHRNVTTSAYVVVWTTVTLAASMVPVEEARRVFQTRVFFSLSVTERPPQRARHLAPQHRAPQEGYRNAEGRENAMKEDQRGFELRTLEGSFEDSDVEMTQQYSRRWRDPVIPGG